MAHLTVDPPKTPPLRGTHTSPHAEGSWAVAGLDDAEARAIGAEYFQVAVFRLEKGLQTVLGCAGDWQMSRSL